MLLKSPSQALPLREVPPQSLLRKASSPKGTPLSNAGNFPATTKAVPLGKVASPQAMTEGVFSFCRPLSQGGVCAMLGGTSDFLR